MELWMVGVGAVVASTAVLFAYLVFIWWLDRYEREPFWLVLVTFAWGAIGATGLAICLSLVFSLPADALLSETYSTAFSLVIVAPFVEEFTKGLVFAALLLTPHLDNETDGLIYGAAVGLGFAALENLLYFAAAAAEGPEMLISTVVMRTLFSALIHTISSALLGYTVGYVRHRKLLPWLWLFPIAGFAASVINHGLWNFLVSLAIFDSVGETMAAGALGLGVLVVVAMAAVMFALTQWSLWREHKIIARYLCDEARQGTLPRQHAEIIPYWRKRRKKNWLPSRVPRKDYVEAATLLAFRRYQQDTAAPRYRDRYEEDVRKYRAAVGRYMGNKAGRGGRGRR